MPINFNRGTQINQNVTLKRGVDQNNFNNTVNTAFSKVEQGTENRLLDKRSYKALKDMMVGGRKNLNEVLSQAGVASVKDLEQIFARKTNLDNTIKISPAQERIIKNLLSSNASVSGIPTNEERQVTQLIQNIQNSTSVDMNNETERFNIEGIIKLPEVKSEFQKFCIKEFNDESLDFINNFDAALKNPNNDVLQDIFNRFIPAETSPKEINLDYDTRITAVAIFTGKDLHHVSTTNNGTTTTQLQLSDNNRNYSMEDKINILATCRTKMVSLIDKDIIGRFQNSNEGKVAMQSDILKRALKYSSVSQRSAFLNNILNTSTSLYVKNCVKHLLTGGKSDVPNSY